LSRLLKTGKIVVYITFGGILLYSTVLLSLLCLRSKEALNSVLLVVNILLSLKILAKITRS